MYEDEPSEKDWEENDKFCEKLEEELKHQHNKAVAEADQFLKSIFGEKDLTKEKDTNTKPEDKFYDYWE